jgi:hypothetical protein
MAEVFVSYASQDRDRVGSLVREIEAAGCSVWWDREIGAGAAFDREIEKAIDEARCIVVVWTKDSVESEWVRTEANEGLQRGNLVPVAIEHVRPPLAFRRIQALEFEAADFGQSLVAAIAKHLPTVNAGEGLPVVGRARELERLAEGIAAAKRGEGGFILFSGEAGIGKTRLIAEAEKLARAADILVLRGHCTEADTAPPYQPLLEQTEHVARLLGPERMRERMGENATELAKLMPELRSRYSDIAEFPTLPPEQERRYLLHGVSEFIARGAKVMPLVLVYEDLHLADESTCVLLRYLAERLRDEPVLLLGAYRDTELAASEPFGRLLQQLTRERIAEDLCLARLTRKEIVELLVRGFAAEPPPALVELVYGETEGNPFFIDELVRQLQESGKLLTETGKFQSRIEIADTEVARGVKLMIEDRLERADPVCREVLTLAAVAGRTFSFDLLARADAKRGEDALLDAIEAAERARLIEDASQGRVARYRFAHEQIRQTLLAALSLPRRQRLHLRVADALEADGEDFARAGEIGHHLYQAGSAAQPARTARLLSLAGQRAMDTLAFEDALRQFDLALSVLAEADAAEVAALQALRSDALRGCERIPEALQALNIAVDLAHSREAKDDFILRRCRMLLDLWRGEEALADLEKLSARAQAGGDGARELEVQRWLARAYYVMSLDRTGFTDKCKEAYERAIELARAQGARKTLASALVATAQLVDYWPDYRDQAQANLAEAKSIAVALDDDEIDIDAATAGIILMGDVPLEEGEALLARLATRRDPIRLNAHYFRMMWATLAAGRPQRCVDICDAGIALARRIGAEPVQYPTIKALALMELGRLGEAWATLDEEVADEGHRFGAALQAAGRMQYEVAVGAFPAALERAAHVIAEAHVLARAWMLDWVSLVLADLAPLCPAELERVKSLIAETGVPPNELGRASLALAPGDVMGARKALAEGSGEERFSPMLSADLWRLSLTAAIAAAENKKNEALAALAEATDLARQRSSRRRLWELLARRGALGDAEAAAEARVVHAEIAETIPDPAHRKAFAAFGKRLGLNG